MGSSLLDYFIAPPSLFFDRDGAPLPGSKLNVLTHVDFRVTSDHWPVALSLPHGVLPTTNPKPSPRRQRRRKREDRDLNRWVWSDELQATYVNELSNGDCAHALEELLEHDPLDFIPMIQYIKAAIQDAATKAGIPQRTLLPSKQKKQKRFCNRASAPWYGLACVASHQKIGKATGGVELRQAIRSYNLTVRREKREYSRAREAKLADLLQHKPKQFWQTVRRSANAGCSIGKQTIFDYYRALREPATVADATDPIIHKYYETVPDMPHAVDLDTAFTVADTITALDTLKSGKTADCNGDVAELFTKAVVDGHYLLAPHLTRTINAIFFSGKFPDSESLGMIISIFKGKGDASDCGNYRGITIITVLSKLYATMINGRLSTWRLHSADRRAKGQGGFLKKHRTTDHLFTLQHIIDKYRTKKFKPLYTCFVDLSKAFDTISRPKLWQRLHEMGIRGQMLSALQAYYSNVRECVKSNEGLTDCFDSCLGVKQGCPLSPTLFGLYVDALENFICSNMEHEGTVELGGCKVPLLLYADDIVFFATSEKEMQKLLDIFSDFCYKYELTVNLTKTEILVFSSARAGVKANVKYRNTPVPQNTKYKYLGVIFNSKTGMKLGGDNLLAAARRALFALEKQLREENISSPSLAFQMFDSLISPIISYGSEIWGCYDKTGQADTLQLGFIKRVLRVPMGTDTEVVLAESGRLPFKTKLWENQARYWDRLRTITEQNGTRLVALAFVENCQMFRERKSCWSLSSMSGMQHLGMDISVCPTAVSVRNHMACKSAEALRASVHVAATDHRDWYTHPTYQHADGERRRTYTRWFWQGARATAMDMNDAKLRNELIRFRMGAHGLRVVTGAWAKGGFLDRRNRVCKCCRMGIVEDEFHFVFECPAYQHIRQRFINLFCNDTIQSRSAQLTIIISDTEKMMQNFFCQDQYQIAKFISVCRRERTLLA
jgi:hypothetical protein